MGISNYDFIISYKDQIASDIEELENLKEKRPFIHSNKQFQKRPFIHNNEQFNYPSKRDELEGICYF